MNLNNMALGIKSSFRYDLKKAEKYFVIFGVFLNINFLFLHFIKVRHLGRLSHVLPTIEILISILSYGLILKDFWLDGFKKFKILYWYVILFISLPLYFSLMLLLNQPSVIFKLYNFLGAIILAMLVRIAAFVIIYLSGVLFSYAIYYCASPDYVLDVWVAILLLGFFIAALTGKIIFWQCQLIMTLKQIIDKAKFRNRRLIKKSTQLQLVVVNEENFINNLIFRLERFVGSLTISAKKLLYFWDDWSENEKHRQLNSIFKLSDRLGASVGDLRILKTLNSKSLRINCGKVNLAKVIDDAIEQLRITYLNRGLSIEKDFSSDEDYLIDLDLEMISKVLEKLASYGIDYWNSSDILIRLRGDMGFFEIDIENKVLEIKDAKINDLFLAFSSNVSLDTNDFCSLDIDLAVCKAIVKNFNGYIRIDNACSGMVIFRITLPR